MDTGDFLRAGVFVAAYGEFVVASSTVFGNGAFCGGIGIIGGAACGVRVKITGESIRGIGHLILHSGGVSLLRGVDSFDVEVFSRVGGLEGAGI